MEVSLHPTPRWGEVVVEQIRAVGLSLRPVMLVFAAVLLGGTVLIVGEIVVGNPGFDSRETLPTALVSFLLPFAVWRGERRFGPAFLWTLPVDRRQLALAKVLAGGVWTLVALTVFVVWLATLALIDGARPADVVIRIPFVETIGTYLLGSALVLGLRHPLRWLLGAAGLLLLVGVGSDMLVQPNDGEWRYVPGAQAFFSVIRSSVAAFQTLPEPVLWMMWLLLWLGGGFAALLAAASRHREQRRR